MAEDGQSDGKPPSPTAVPDEDEGDLVLVGTCNADEVDETERNGEVIEASALPAGLKGRSRLTKEQQATVFEILRCAVCLEIPKGKPVLQVKACEKGHHFCFSCHKQLKSCAICRGRLFHGRNFVVEELITKLGSVLGVSKVALPLPKATPQPAAGLYPCPHHCGNKLSSRQMLPHLRAEHGNNLADNMRSNPFTGRMDYKFLVNMTDQANKSAVYSIQVSDMGLFTICVQMEETEVLAWVQTLQKDTESAMFRYRLLVRVSGHREYAVHDVPVLSPFALATMRKHLLQLPKNLLINEKQCEVHVAFWRTTDTALEPDFNAPSIDWDFPAAPLVFSSDRNTRRNRNRNDRRNRTRKKHKELAAAAASAEDTVGSHTDRDRSRLNNQNRRRNNHRRRWRDQGEQAEATRNSDAEFFDELFGMENDHINADMFEVITNPESPCRIS